MDRDVLEGYLAAGLSLNEIGTRVGREPSTVGYWVQKHGLTANGRRKFAPRGGLAREELEALVATGSTLREMAGALDRSVSTVRYWPKHYGLETKNGHGPRPSAVDGPHEVLLRCRRHGLTDYFYRRSDGIYRCKRCRSEAVTKRRRRVKEILVQEAGGSCVLCGYDRCSGALQFHHADPDEKSFALSRKGITRGIDVLREEARKCVLLCANCHAEVEVGLTELPLDLLPEPTTA